MSAVCVYAHPHKHSQWYIYGRIISFRIVCIHNLLCSYVFVCIQHTHMYIIYADARVYKTGFKVILYTFDIVQNTLRFPLLVSHCSFNVIIVVFTFRRRRRRRRRLPTLSFTNTTGGCVCVGVRLFVYIFVYVDVDVDVFPLVLFIHSVRLQFNLLSLFLMELLNVSSSTFRRYVVCMLLLLFYYTLAKHLCAPQINAPHILSPSWPPCLYFICSITHKRTFILSTAPFFFYPF